MADETLEPLLRAIDRECAAFPEVAAAWLFGSVARGEARADSDVDVGIIPATRWFRMDDRRVGDLASRLESALGRPCDLVELEAQGWSFANQALVEGKLAFSPDENRRVDFETTAATRADDERPMREIFHREKVPAMLRRLESRR